MTRWTLLAVSLLVACTVDEPGPQPLPERDVDRFAAEVQPFLGAGCGSLDCHGASDRPLRLFAVHGRRARGDLRGQELTAAELVDNVAALAAIPTERVLGKPLAVSAGGMHHEGGELWSDVDAPEYVCLAAWLDGATRPDACSAIDVTR